MITPEIFNEISFRLLMLCNVSSYRLCSSNLLIQVVFKKLSVNKNIFFKNQNILIRTARENISIYTLEPSSTKDMLLQYLTPLWIYLQPGSTMDILL